MSTQFTANNIKSLFCSVTFPCQVPSGEQPRHSTSKLIFIRFFFYGFLWCFVVALFMILISFQRH